jgi:hypothetical protein
MYRTVHHAPYAPKLPMQEEGNTNNHDWKRPGLAEICRPSLGLFSICKSHINQPKSTGGPHYCNPDLPLLSCLAAGLVDLRFAVSACRLFSSGRSPPAEHNRPLSFDNECYWKTDQQRNTAAVHPIPYGRSGSNLDNLKR